MNVKGLKITDILNIDLDSFNSLNESQLRALTSRLVSASNKRIRRLEKHDINSPAIQGLGSNKSFSTKLKKTTPKNQRINQLRSEFARIRTFLTSQTSTIKGFNKFVKDTRKRLAKETGLSEKDIKNIDVNKVFDKLHELQQKGYVSSYRGSKGSLQARNKLFEIAKEYPDLDADELADYLFDELEEAYESDIYDDLEDETDETDFDY